MCRSSSHAVVAWTGWRRKLPVLLFRADALVCRSTESKQLGGTYCKTLYSHCIFIDFSTLESVEILRHFYLAFCLIWVRKTRNLFFLQPPGNRHYCVYCLRLLCTVHNRKFLQDLLIFYSEEFLVMGKLKFCMYLILLHEEYMFYSKWHVLLHFIWITNFMV